MATPANTTNTYSSVGNREDLSDVIYDISPTETPFLSGIKHLSATGTNHEWQIDSLAAASNNAVIEGDDATTTVSIPSVRIGNYTQISDKVPRVTRTQRQVNSAGRGDELDYQIMKSAKELKNDMETGLLANKAKVGGSTILARQFGGIGSWIATNQSVGVGGVAPTGTGIDTRTDGAQRVLTNLLLKGVLSACWDQGGNPDTIMTGSFNKQAMSAFVTGGTSGSAQRIVTGDDSRLHTSVDIYISDFGELRVQPNRFMRPRDMLVLEMDKWSIASLADFEETPLAKTGDSDRVQLLSEYTLQADNQKASGIVADLTTA